MPTSADIDLIRRVIPHRYPFLLVDRVRDIVPFKSAIGVKCVTANEPQFQGHFPTYPIFPGVSIVEAMAQTAAILVGLSEGRIDKMTLVYFMSIDKCKFRKMVRPGDVIEMKMTALRGKAGGKVWRFGGECTVDGAIAAEAEVTAMLDATAVVGGTL